jgi:hypothetical protein
MAARRVQSLFDNTENYPAYHWNEGLSRAARHYLNEHSACGTSGDIYSMGYSQILSAYYVWNVLGLDF